MDEVIYLDEGDAVVTSSRVVLSGKTYATRNIGSVSVEEGGVSVIAILVLLIGLVMIKTTWFGWVVALGAAFYAYRKYQERQISIMAGGGEAVGLVTHDSAKAARVHEALVKAIAAR